jgi:hypothetical protein
LYFLVKKRLIFDSSFSSNSIILFLKEKFFSEALSLLISSILLSNELVFEKSRVLELIDVDSIKYNFSKGISLLKK